MTDMRLGRLPHGTDEDHTAYTLSGRVAHMSPSSSGAAVQLSLLEGDCVGLTWPIPQAGLSWARLFFCPSLPVEAFSPKSSHPSLFSRPCLFHRQAVLLGGLTLS